MKTIGEIVANNVRRERVKQRLTQPELAKLAGVSLQTIFRVETGKTLPQEKNLTAIAKALGCKSKEELYLGVDNGSKIPHDILMALAQADDSRLDDIRLLLRIPIPERAASAAKKKA